MPSQHRDNRQRIVLDSEGLSLHSDDMPKLVELPKHTAQLLLQRGQLEKNEIVGLIDLVKDDEDALRAAYTLAVNSIDLGFTFSSIVKPGFLKKEEQLAFQRCIKAWAGITQSELFENVWVTFEERPSAYLQDLHLPSKILILLREMQKVSPTTTLVSSATPEQFLGESAIRVNELPKIELILKHSKFPAADISFLCDSETHRPTRKELQAYYDGGHRALSHRFLFRERQVVDIQPSAEERRLQAIEPLIREFADLEDDIDVEKFLPSRDRFAFLSQGAKKAFTPEEDFILQAIEVLSKHVESLNEEPRNALLNDLCDVSPELRGAAFELLENLCIASVPLANYSGIVATLASHRGDLPNGCLEVLTATSRLKPQLFVEATAVVEDLLQHETDLTEFVPLFEQGEIAPLIREVYIKRLREHQQRFPEKALEEVRIAFESPEVGGITEPAKVEALEMAFSLYERIQAEGEVLIGTPRPTLREEIQKLVSKIGAKQKPEVEEQVSEKDAVDQEVNLDGDLVRYLALSRELFRAHFGVYPYNTQVIAAILLIRADSFEQSSKSGVYAQVKTGEGKSLLTTLLAGYYAAQGRKVDIVTSNTYLAERDAKKFADYFADQGFSCISHEHGEGVETVSSDPSIIYSTNHDMIFTYLRSRLEGVEFFAGKRFDVAIVDEADNLCLDLGEESVRIAGEMKSRFSEHQLMNILNFMSGEGRKFYPSNIDTAVLHLTELRPEFQKIPKDVLWIHLHSAGRSAQMVRDEDYILSGEGEARRVVLVDKDHTGRLKTRSQWQHGVYEFVTLREDLNLRPSTALQAQKHHPDFLKMYKRLSCISGTFGDEVERQELREVYSLVGFDVPTHHPSKREDLPVEIYRSRRELTARLDQIVEGRLNGERARPLLILAKTIEQSKFLSSHLRSRRVNHQLMNGEETRDQTWARVSEERVVAEAGKAGTNTLSTNLSGRGTDIVLDKRAEEAKGLISVQTSFPVSLRVEIQGRGRAGRQGLQGTSLVIACVEDDEFLKNLPLNLANHLDTLGGDSPEMQKILHYLRQSSNLVEGVRRRTHAQNEAATQELQEYFFSKLHALSERLGQANRRMKKIEGLPAGADPLSLAVTTVWGPIFQDFDLALKIRELRYKLQRVGKGGDEQYVSPITQRLDQIFEQTFGKPHTDLNKGNFVEELADALHRSRKRLVHQVEDEVAYSDPIALKTLVAAGQYRVDEMIEKMFHNLEWRGKDGSDARAANG